MLPNLCHLTLKNPPEFLFVAVGYDSYDKAFKNGLKRRKTPFIDMYENDFDARRKSKKKYTFVFAILARVMAEDGYRFYLAETGEWLTDEIPAHYLRLV